MALESSFVENRMKTFQLIHMSIGIVRNCPNMLMLKSYLGHLVELMVPEIGVMAVFLTVRSRSFIPTQSDLREMSAPDMIVSMDEVFSVIRRNLPDLEGMTFGQLRELGIKTLKVAFTMVFHLDRVGNSLVGQTEERNSFIEEFIIHLDMLQKSMAITFFQSILKVSNDKLELI